MNSILGKAMFYSLIILLNSGESSYIVLGRKKCNKKINPVTWNTHAGDFLTIHITNVEFILPEFDATKIATWKFNVEDSQENEG